MDNKSAYWRMILLNVIDDIGVEKFDRSNIDQQYIMLKQSMTHYCDSQEEYDENIKAICDYLEY